MTESNFPIEKQLNPILPLSLSCEKIFLAAMSEWAGFEYNIKGLHQHLIYILIIAD